MRKERRIRKAENIIKVLSEFKDLKHLEIFRTEGRRQYINMMKDKEGQEYTYKKDIAEVFATFFKELYNGSGTEILYREAMDTIENITSEEIKGELKHMASNKAGDENGVIIEMFVHASDNFLGILADLFSSIMKPETAVPEYWKISSIRVLFKKGDDRLPENYRPICIIPIMYKLFSRILTGRIKKQIYKEQSADQAGFRPGFSCDDHLFTLSILTEKYNEFNIPLWVTTLDFKKAFDSVKHNRTWEALRE